MTLNTTQSDHIISATEHFFFDLPTDPKKLQEKIEEFKKAIQKQLPKEHDLFHFQQCFYEPNVYLRGIEKSNPATIGEVHLYLFNYALNELKKAASIAKLEWKDEEWEALLNSIKQNKQY